MAHQHRVQYGYFIKFIVILAQYGHPFSGVNTDISACGINIATQYFKECRFTSTIGTDYAIAVPCGEFEVHFVKENTFSELKRDVVCCNHDRVKKIKGQR